jgi:hypothetical protein
LLFAIKAAAGRAPSLRDQRGGAYDFACGVS